jgi:hypothetical protein
MRTEAQGSCNGGVYQDLDHSKFAEVDHDWRQGDKILFVPQGLEGIDGDGAALRLRTTHVLRTAVQILLINTKTLPARIDCRLTVFRRVSAPPRRGWIWQEGHVRLRPNGLAGGD